MAGRMVEVVVGRMPMVMVKKGRTVTAGDGDERSGRFGR